MSDHYSCKKCGSRFDECECPTRDTKGDEAAAKLRTALNRTDSDGVSVVTVKDGWLFIVDKQKMMKMLTDSDKDKLVIFVKSSAKIN